MASASSYSSLVQELYVAYFGRPADYFGLQNFEAALAAANAPTDPAALAAAYSTNAAVKTLVDSFGTSHESTALYGSGSTESFVNAIFENLFNRPAAVAGLTFWVNAINSGAVSKGDAALAILAGAESNSTTQGKADWTLIGNKIGVASNFTTALGSSSSQIVAYAGATAAQDARLMLSGVTASTTPATFDVQTTINNIVAGNSQNTYNLTTGVDTLTGGTGNNVFNAILDNATGLTAGGQAATLQSFDSITGGTSNNTLNITDFGKSYFMTIPSGAAISGITTVNVNTLESIGSSPSTPVDFSALGANMAAVNINSSYGVDSVKVGTSTALAVTNTFANGDVYTTGGSSVTINNNSSSSVQGNYIHVTGDASTTSVTVNNGFNNTMVVYDANYASTSKANTISTVTLNNLNQYHSVNLYTSALTQLNLTNVSNTWINEQVDTTGTARTLNVALNGLDSATPASYTEVYTYATTVDVATSGAASVGFYLYAGNATTVAFNDAADLSFFNGTSVGSGYLVAPSATSLTIAGAGAFTADLSGLAAGAAINASGSSGTITVNMASANSGDATQSFTGGTGQDIVTVGAGQTGTVTGGSATNNEIILDNAPGATEAALAAYSHFSILGVAGSTSGTFDMSKLPGYNSFDVQSSSGNVTFTNVAIPTDTTHPLSLSLEGGNTHVVTLQTNDKTGANDSVSVTLGTTSTGSNSYAQVTLEDSIFGGIGTVNLASNVKASASANTLTSLYDNNWVTLNVSGTGSLDIGTSKVSSSSLTINNTEVAHGTGSLNIANLNDNSLTSLTFNGTDGTTIANLNTTSTGLTLIDNDTAAVKITTLNDTALTSATFTNSVNSTAATFTIGGTLTEAGLATLNLNGNVKISVAGDAVTTGITVAGATDNADVSFSATGATASGKANSIALGNGNDTVVLGTASVAAVPGATETDTVTWQPIAGTAPATEKIDVTWQAFSTLVAGTETIGGMTITSDGSAIFSADQVAKVAAGVASVPGLTLTTPASGWTVATGVGTTDTYFTSTTANTAEPTPTDATATGSGATPTFTETTVGTPGTGGTESIGGVTVSTTINGTYNAGQVAIVAAGGSVPGLSLTSTPTLWAVGTASGSSNLFTSTTANHAEPGPAGATATGAGSAPTSVQTTAGVTPVPASGGGGLAGSSDTITVGTGNDSITDFSAGTVTVSATESSTSTDSITANVASTLHVTAGNGINTISDTAASASTTISVGTGANSITVGNMASGTIALGTHAATVADTITLGNSGSVTTSVAGMEKISGLNNVGADTLVFTGDGAPITAITEITATQVHNLGGDTTLLADWIATAAGKGAAVTANTVAWFSYQGNTYLVNLTAADHGNLSASDTVVELTGTYTFANTHFGGNGTIHLMG